MNTIFLIAAALVLPLIWGYLAEWLVRRIWPHPPEAARSSNEDDQKTPYLDYQI